MLNELFEIQSEIAKSVDLSFKRSLYREIHWESRLISIMGARGVGKTTLLLQYYKEHFATPEACLYISADHIKVTALGLYEIANIFYKGGGQLLIIDEIHRYTNWAQELKNIYDSFPKLRIAISGSSMLDILKGRYDLSRRMVLYYLHGLSFREFLILETRIPFESLSLTNILHHHVAIASRTVEKIKILNHFQHYLRYGFYPFYLEDKDLYTIKLMNIVEKVVSEDIPSVFGIKPTSTSILKKMIFLIASSQPFSPNIDKMSSQLALSKEYVYYYLECLEKAGLFSFLPPPSKGFKGVRKPAKIFMENPNLFCAVLGKSGVQSEIGAVRESFFLNQLKNHHEVVASEAGDFKVDDHYTFEIGGKNKPRDQIRDVPNAYLALDGIEVGHGATIPLWLFGFLY